MKSVENAGVNIGRKKGNNTELDINIEDISHTIDDILRKG